MSKNNKNTSAARLKKLELVRHRRLTSLYALKVNRLMTRAINAQPNTVSMAFTASFPGNEDAGAGVIYIPPTPPPGPVARIVDLTP